jgi:transposase
VQRVFSAVNIAKARRLSYIPADDAKRESDLVDHHPCEASTGNWQ